MVTDYCELFKNTIRGKYDKRSNSKLTKDLPGGAAIKVAFNSLLKDYTDGYKATKDYTDEDISKAMAMHEGDNMPGFPAVDVFIYLMQPQLEKLRDPVTDCLLDTHAYLDSLSHTIIERVFYRFPTLAAEINEIASQVLLREREKTRSIVDCIIESEEGYIFTNDFEYLTQRTEIIPKADGKAKTSENVFVNEIRTRIDSYFKIVIRNVRDSVPKVIGHFLVRSIMNTMQLELYERINNSESIINQLSEPPNISAEREGLRKQLETLRKAEKILKHNPEFSKHTENIAKEIHEQEEKFKEEENRRKNKSLLVDDTKKEESRDEGKSEAKTVVKAPEPKGEKTLLAGGMFGKADNPVKSNFFSK